MNMEQAFTFTLLTGACSMTSWGRVQSLGEFGNRMSVPPIMSERRQHTVSLLMQVLGKAPAIFSQ